MNRKATVRKTSQRVLRKARKIKNKTKNSTECTTTSNQWIRMPLFISLKLQTEGWLLHSNATGVLCRPSFSEIEWLPEVRAYSVLIITSLIQTLNLRPVFKGLVLDWGRDVLYKVLYVEALPWGPISPLLKRYPICIPFIEKRHHFHIFSKEPLLCNL